MEPLNSYNAELGKKVLIRGYENTDDYYVAVITDLEPEERHEFMGYEYPPVCMLHPVQDGDEETEEPWFSDPEEDGPYHAYLLTEEEALAWEL